MGLVSSLCVRLGRAFALGQCLGKLLVADVLEDRHGLYFSNRVHLDMAIRFAPQKPAPVAKQSLETAVVDIPAAKPKRTKTGGRKRSDDPNVLVSIRVPQSVVARYQSLGDDWRARMAADLSK